MPGYTRPKGLNHVAYVTWDTAETVRFYTKILGMRLIGHALADQVGSTGEPAKFLHTFFEMADGSCIAFFEIEGVERDEPSPTVPLWARHLALSVGSLQELHEAKERLQAEGIEVRGPVDHEGIWTSIYFFDPNGIRLELTYQNRPLAEADAERAQRAVDDWIIEHQRVAR